MFSNRRDVCNDVDKGKVQVVIKLPGHRGERGMTIIGELVGIGPWIIVFDYVPMGEMLGSYLHSDCEYSLKRYGDDLHFVSGKGRIISETSSPRASIANIETRCCTVECLDPIPGSRIAQLL